MSGLGDLHLSPDLFGLVVAAMVFLAAVHAYTKLSPYFCTCWFGAGLVFGWLWSDRPEEASAILVPVLVFYIAAAVTKGLVETRERLAGNHVLHVVMTGVFSGVIALPLESGARVMGWAMPAPALGLKGLMDGPVDPDLLGGVPILVLVVWVIAGTVFYGAYKLLDHSGLPAAWRTVLLFVGMPFLVQLVDGLADQL